MQNPLYSYSQLPPAKKLVFINLGLFVLTLAILWLKPTFLKSYTKDLAIISLGGFIASLLLSLLNTLNLIDIHKYNLSKGWHWILLSAIPLLMIIIFFFFIL